MFSLSDSGLIFGVMVGTAIYSGDFLSPMDLLSSEIQNFLVIMSLSEIVEYCPKSHLMCMSAYNWFVTSFHGTMYILRDKT